MFENKKIFLVLFSSLVLFFNGCESYGGDKSSGGQDIPNNETSIVDSDIDGLSDSLEYHLIETFKPVLVFDENEPLDVVNETATFYQVSNVKKNGHPGALITIVIAYTNDLGIPSVDIDGWDHLTCLAGVGDILAFVASQLPLDGHCGDTEAVKYFVAKVGDEWQLQEIIMRRHKEKEWTFHDARIFEYQGTHPVIYVSQSKHAMYPSKSACEGYTEKIYNVGISCEIHFENCGGGMSIDLFTPAQNNVGEKEEQSFDLLEDVTTLFPGEYAWSNKPFCGGFTYDSCESYIAGRGWGDKPCAGPLSGKWYPDW